MNKKKLLTVLAVGSFSLGVMALTGPVGCAQPEKKDTIRENAEKAFENIRQEEQRHQQSPASDY